MNTNGYDQSKLMSAYNYARHFGKRTGLFDVKRVDRALGYLMSIGDKAASKWYEYGTALNGRDGRCSCPDHQYRGVYCKHIISMQIDCKYHQLKEATV